MIINAPYIFQSQILGNPYDTSMVINSLMAHQSESPSRKDKWLSKKLKKTGRLPLIPVKCFSTPRCGGTALENEFLPTEHANHAEDMKPPINADEHRYDLIHD